MKISQLLSASFSYCRTEDTLQKVARGLLESPYVVVTDTNGRAQGLITPRDVVRAVAENAAGRTAAEVMRREIPLAREDTLVEDLVLLTDLPVVVMVDAEGRAKGVAELPAAEALMAITGGIHLIYRCNICGQIQDRLQLPDHCPNCGAPREEFELVSED